MADAVVIILVVVLILIVVGLIIFGVSRSKKKSNQNNNNNNKPPIPPPVTPISYTASRLWNNITSGGITYADTYVITETPVPVSAIGKGITFTNANISDTISIPNNLYTRAQIVAVLNTPGLKVVDVKPTNQATSGNGSLVGLGKTALNGVFGVPLGTTNSLVKANI